MASSEKALEEMLLEAGDKLLKPPSSVNELLLLLDQVENYLSRVEQSPSKSMQAALCPSLKALVAIELLRHSDMDVKVAVASCISEITRITAPDAPYDDDQMKEIFQLIVAAFEKLFDMSGQSYAKRVSILETVAKVRSCVVMLDLECDSLILEMFQHFLKAIREDHPENVFSSMETIMSLVLEESEDISPELLSPLLASVKKENQDVLPIARKLGEKVMENCAAKLRPYMMQAVQSMGNSLNDYSKIVTSICQETSDTVEHNDTNASGEQLADESKLSERNVSDEPQQVAKEVSQEVACPGTSDSGMEKAPKSVMSNGTARAVTDDSTAEPQSPKKKLDRCHRVNQSKSSDGAPKAETDGLESQKVVKSETKSDQITKKTRGRKPNTLMAPAEASDPSRTDGEKEAVQMLDREKGHSKETDNVPSEGPSTKDEAVPSGQEKETQVQLSSPTGSQGEVANVASPPSQNLTDGSRSKRGRRGPKKKESTSQEADPGSPSVPKEVLPSDHDEDEAKPSTAAISKKESEATSDSEAKPHRRSGKKASSGNASDKTPAPVDIAKESVRTSDSEAKSQRKSNKKVDEKNAHEDESSGKEQEGKKKQGKGKSVSEKDVVEEASNKKIVSSPRAAAKTSKRDQAQPEETSVTKSKRKRTPGKEEAAETPLSVKGHGENLVGAKIKVWWPIDHQFYKGVIDSFNPVKKKHKVLYDDGDEEILNLRKERWEFIGDKVSDGDQEADLSSPDASEMHQKKKTKTNLDSSTKQARSDASSKRGGGTSASKSKVEARKSGSKSRDDGKVNGKSKEDTPKAVGKSKDGGGKSKDDTPKASSKLKDETQKTAGKSKDDNQKVSTKSKDETPKISSSKSKGETPKTGSKSNANGSSSKGKSGSSKVHESEESSKGKLSDSAKAQENETKSGKKRPRKVNG